MKILLVGGFGFIGKRFIRKFSGIHEIIVYAQHENILKTGVDTDMKNLIVEEGGVEDEKIVNMIIKHKPDAVIHLAAITGLKKCHDDPKKAFEINVYGTSNVVNACSKTGVKLIFISSREVYGETLNNESKESDPLLPRSIYGITKMLSEILIIQEGLRNNLDYTILRLTNVYGPEGDQYGAQVIIRNAIKTHRVQMLGRDQRLNYVYVDDVVELIDLVLRNKRTSKEIFNVGSKDTVTIREFIKEVSELMNNELDIEYLPMRETETINFNPSLEKLQTVLGYLPKTSLRDGIEKTIKYYS